jgi:hypothetical protein
MAEKEKRKDEASVRACACVRSSMWRLVGGDSKMRKRKDTGTEAKNSSNSANCVACRQPSGVK